MKKRLLLFFIFLAASATAFSQVRLQDSLALVTLYHETNGPSWHSNMHWLNGPVSTWHGITITNERVTVIDLNNNGLQGTLPEELGELTSLTTLDLGHNQLTGDIPEELGNLANIINLYLYKNLFTGTIPDSFAGLDKVERIHLHENQLTGNIPAGFNSLISLTKLSLHQNQLNGLPDLSMLPLDTLNASHNDFTFEDLTPNLNIPHFEYAPQNKTNADQIIALDTGDRQTLNGAVENTSNQYQWYKNGIPVTDGGSSQFTIHHFDANDTGVYHCLITNNQLAGLVLSTGNFTLKKASVTTDSTALVALYQVTDGIHWTDTSWLKGPIHTWSGVTLTGGRVTGINLPHNNLQGTLPLQLGNLTHLKNLNLSENSLNGDIPITLGTLDSLTTLRLYHNNLNGSIPDELGNLMSLDTLELHQNNLIEHIPTSLGNLVSLTHLDLSNNELSGIIPTTLGQLDSLRVLLLGHNRLTGGIPMEIENLGQLMSLSLRDNEAYRKYSNRTG